MAKYIKIDNAYINTAFITSVCEEKVGSLMIGNEWVDKNLVVIRTTDGNLFNFKGTIDEAMALVKGEGT
jgi:hypothetical protein